MALLAVGLSCSALAQAATPTPLSFPQLTHKAGFIFAGRVLAVNRPSPTAGRLPTILVTLRVERPLRGTRKGEIFALSQWAGAWDKGPQYRLGQRLLLFLYPRAKTGLTSVVGGRLGQFDLDSAGNIVLRRDQERLLLASGNPPSARARNRVPAPARLRYRDFAGQVRAAQK